MKQRKVLTLLTVCFSLLMAVSIVSCESKLTPCSEPTDTVEEPDEPDPDPTPDELVVSNGFITLTKAGALAKIPYPFIEFSEGETELLAFENKYKSADPTTKIVGDADPKRKRYIFDPKDPDKLCTKRLYEIKNEGKDNLYLSAVALNYYLIFGQNDQMLPSVNQLLEKDGYFFVEDGDMGRSYSNDETGVLLTVMATTTKSVAMLAFIQDPTHSPKPTTKYDFHADVKDFPLLLPFSEMTIDKVKKHEADKGYRKEHKSTAMTALYAPAEGEEGNVNFQLMYYDLNSEAAPDGTAAEPKVMATTKNMTIEMALNDANIAQWFMAQGFDAPKDLEGSGKSAVTQNAEWMLTLLPVEDYVAFVFKPKNIDAGGGDDPVATEPFLVMPLLDYFGKSFDEGSDLWKAEVARGYTTKISSYIDGVYQLDVSPDYVAIKDLPKGVQSWYYTTWNSEAPKTVEEISVMFDRAFVHTFNIETESRDAVIDAFFKKSNFEFDSFQKNDKYHQARWYYLCAEKNIVARFTIDLEGSLKDACSILIYPVEADSKLVK